MNNPSPKDPVELARQAHQEDMLSLLDPDNPAPQEASVVMGGINDILRAGEFLRGAEYVIQAFQDEVPNPGEEKREVWGIEQDSGHQFKFMEMKPKDASATISLFSMNCRLAQKTERLSEPCGRLQTLIEGIGLEDRFHVFRDGSKMDLSPVLKVKDDDSLLEFELGIGDEANPYISIRIEPMATDSFKSGIPSEFPASITISPEGFSITFIEGHFMLPTNDKGNPLNWTSGFLQNFIDEKIIPLLEEKLQQKTAESE